MPRKKFKKRIFLKYLTPLLLITTMSLLMSGLLLSFLVDSSMGQTENQVKNQSSGDMKKEIAAKYESLANQYAKMIADTLQNVETKIIPIAHLLAQAKPKELRTQSDLFSQTLMETDDNILHFWFFNNRDSVINTFCNNHYDYLLHENNILPLTIAGKIKKGKKDFVRLHFDEENTFYYTYLAQKIQTKEGQILGSIVLQYQLQFLEKALGSQTAQDIGQMEVLDGEKSTFTTPLLTKNTKRNKNKYGEHKTRILKEQKGSFFEHDLIAYATNQYGWTLVLVAPVDQALAAIFKQNEAFAGMFGNTIDHLLEMIVWIMLGIILIAAIAGATIAKRMSRPILRLTVATRRAAGGDLNFQVPVMTSDEIGELTDSFNIMTSNIKKQQEDLVDNHKTILKQTKKLSDSNAELEQYAYTVSHDLKEPLRMVSSYVQLLQRKYQDKFDENAQEYMDYALDGSRRMQNIIDDLLNYSRLERNAHHQARRKVAVQKLIQVALQNLQQRIRETDAQIDIVGELPIVYVKDAQIISLFQNLISNALKYCRKIPKIEIRVKEQGNFWQFSIKDNGIGIPKKHLDEVFVVFKRLHSKAEFEGTGIGLASCKKIVAHHGGQIGVMSELGKGSIFYFTLPILSENEPLSTPQQQKAKQIIPKFAEELVG